MLVCIIFVFRSLPGGTQESHESLDLRRDLLHLGLPVKYSCAPNCITNHDFSPFEVCRRSSCSARTTRLFQNFLSNSLSFLVSKATNSCYDNVFLAVINMVGLFAVRISEMALVNTSLLLIMALLFCQLVLNKNAYDFFSRKTSWKRDHSEELSVYGRTMLQLVIRCQCVE